MENQGLGGLNTLTNVIRIVSAIAILAVAIFVALAPNVVYAPVPRVVLFLLVAILPAILFGAEFAAKFEFKLPGLLISASLVTGAIFGLLYLLNHFAKPEEKIAVYQIVDENNAPVTLDFEDAVIVPVTPNGLTVTKFVDGNTVILIFPEQVGQAEILVKKSPSDVTYTGQVNYAGTRRSKLMLGTDLQSSRR